MHVLVVDDNIINRKIYSKIVEKLGCTANAVSNGKEALDYLSNPSAACPRPDIIFMDVVMPIMDGYEATHIIRTHPPFSTDPKLRATPITAMGVFRIDQTRCMQIGVNDVLMKPFRQDHIKRLLLKWSRWQLVENEVGGSPHFSWARAWGGPAPLRRYQGPRSLL